jgi:hypothetical protein
MSHLSKIVLFFAVLLTAFLWTASDAQARPRIHYWTDPYHGYSPYDPYPRYFVPPQGIRTDAFGRRYFYDPSFGQYRYFNAPGGTYYRTDDDDDDNTGAIIGGTILREMIRRM